MVRTDFVCLTIVDDRGWTLMQERDEHAPAWPDHWCFPGGGLEPGEGPRDGAVRELAKETGVRIEPEELDDLGEFEVRLDGRDTIRYRFYVARMQPTAVPVQCHEGRQMVFVNPATWPDLRKTESTTTVLPALADWLAAHALTAVGPGSHRFAGVILVDRRGWVLLQERDEHPRIDPGKWGLVGGHVEEGEEFDAAAPRELEEETGVRVQPDEITLWREFVVDHREAYGTFDRMQVFVGSTDLTDADIDCREGRRIVFVDPAVAPRLPLSMAAGQILPAFLESDAYAHLREQP